LPKMSHATFCYRCNKRLHIGSIERDVPLNSSSEPRLLPFARRDVENKNVRAPVFTSLCTRCESQWTAVFQVRHLALCAPGRFGNCPRCPMQSFVTGV